MANFFLAPIILRLLCKTEIWHWFKRCASSFNPFDDRAAEEYGLIRADLTARGQMIGIHDIMIAAIALANNLTVVTHNTAEFGRVKGLLIEDWQIP